MKLNRLYVKLSIFAQMCRLQGATAIYILLFEKFYHRATYSLPSINVNPRELIIVNIYGGVNS